MTDHTRTSLTALDGTSIPLRAVEMRGQVLGGTLCMKICQRYENTRSKPLEVLYTFPVPSEATIVGFAMECGERRLEASVLEREAAFERYHDALQAGDGAALLDQERANVFSASLGNLMCHALEVALPRRRDRHAERCFLFRHREPERFAADVTAFALTAAIEQPRTGS